MNFQEIRQKYPDYNDMSDEQFAQKFHQKFYGDMDFDTFAAKVGYSKEPSFDLNRGVKSVPQILENTGKGIVGAGETALNLLTQPFGFAAGAVDTMQQGIDTALDKLGLAKYPESKGKGENRYSEQVDKYSYAPRTEAGKEMVGDVGQAINDIGLPLAASGLPVTEALGMGLSALGKGMARFKAREVPQLSPEAAKILEQRKAAKEIPVVEKTKAQMPQEPIVGAQGDLFRPSPEEIIQKQREQAAAESEGIQRDALGNQGDLFVGEGKPLENPLQRGFQEDQAWNQRNAEVEAAQKADTDLIKQREEVAQEPLTLEPEQASQLLEKISQESKRGIFGLKQRGQLGEGSVVRLTPSEVKYLNESGFFDEFPDVRSDGKNLIFDAKQGREISNWIDESLGTNEGGDRLPPRFYSGELGKQIELGQSKFGRGQRGSVDFSFGTKREEQLIKQEDIEFKQILKELEAHRNHTYAGEALKASQWIQDHHPLLMKVKKLVEGHHNFDIPLEVSIRAEDIMRDMDSMWNRVQVFMHGDPEATVPYSTTKLSPDQGKSYAGSQLSYYTKELDTNLKDLQKYLQSVSDYRTKLNPRSKYDRMHISEIDSVLGNVSKLGQTKVGKGQRGSIGFFGKDPFEKFSEQLKSEIPDITQEEINSAWKDKQQANTQQKVSEAVGKINPKLAENLSIYNDIDKPTALAAIASSPDSPTTSLGFMKNQVLSRGRLGLEKIKNEGVKSGLAYMIGLHDQGGIRANQILHGQDGILRDLRKQEKLFTEGNAGEVLRQRQEAQLNPDFKYNLSPEQTRINNKISKVFEDIRQQMEQLTGKKIAQIPNYFPSMFYGPFAVELRDAGGKLVAFITERSAKAATKEANLVMRELGDGYTMSQPKFRREVTSTGFKNRAGLAPYFEAMLDLLSSDDPAVLKAQESVQRVVAKRAMDTQQMQNRLKYKAGVIGEEGRKRSKDATANYRDAKDVLENYIRGFEEWKANMESAKFVNEVKDTHGATNTYNILQDYFDNLRGTRDVSSKFLKDLETSLAKSGYDISGLSKEVSRKTAGLLTKGWLGFWSPIAMSQNVIQPVITIPKLVELATNGGSKDVVTPFIVGMAKSLKDGFDIATNKVSGRPLGERAQYMRENEVIKPGLVESENKTKVGHYLEKGLVSGGLLSTEAFARATTFNIFESYLENSGYSTTEARTLAKNLTHDYQVNYEKYAKAGMLSNTGIVGELAGRLQSYKINQMTQLANYLTEMVKNKNAAPLAAFVALSVAMAGVSGMIGMDVAEGIYGLMVKAGLIDPSTRSPRQMALDLGGATATGIPSAVTGKWLSGSLTTNLIGDMSWRNIAPIFAGLADAISKAPIAGKWAKDIVTGEHSVPLSEKADLLQTFTPATVRGRWEDRLLTDSEGRVTSPYTGQVNYIRGLQDQDLLSRFTNLRSKERGESIARMALLKNQEKNIKSEIDSRVTHLEKLFDESVRMNRPIDDAVVNREIQKILDLGGDPQQTISQINSFIVKNHLGDWFEQQVASGKVNLGNVNKKMRAMQEREKLYGR